MVSLCCRAVHSKAQGWRQDQIRSDRINGEFTVNNIQKLRRTNVLFGEFAFSFAARAARGWAAASAGGRAVYLNPPVLGLPRAGCVSSRMEATGVRKCP